MIFNLEYTEDSFFVITKDQLEEDLRNAAFECDVEELFQRIISWRKAKGADLFTFEAIDFYDDSEQDDFFATGNTSSFPDENDQTTASAVEAVTHGSTNITIPNTISQVEPSVPASGGLNKITSAVQPRESAPGGLHQTAASSVTAAGGVTSFISAPAFRPGTHGSTNITIPNAISQVEPSVSASGGLNKITSAPEGLHQTAASTVSAAGGLNQTISSSVTTAGGVTSYISAPAFQPGADISTNTPFIVHEIQPSVIASGGLNQTASSSISTVQPSESASGELHQSASSTVSGGVTSFISAPAFRPGTHGSTNHTIPNAISQVEPRVSASGGLNKITSADQPSVSAPEGLHQTATSTVSAAGGLNQTISSSVTTAGGVTSYISAPAFQPGADISTNTPFIVHEIQPSVIASGGLNQTASSSISTVQPSESASGELHQSASSTVSGGVTSFISAPAFRPGTHGSTNHTIPNAISQVEPRVSASGGLNKITSADQPSVSAPEGLHQTASSSVTAAGGVTGFISTPAFRPRTQGSTNTTIPNTISQVEPSVLASGGVTSFISAPAFRPETHGSTNITIPNAVFKVEPSVPASGGLNQTASSTVTAAGGVTSYISAPAFQPGAHISTNTPFIVHEIQPSCTVQPSEFASGGLHQSASSTVPASGGVTSFISAPAFRPGTHGSTNHTIPNTISQVEPSVPASGGLNKITSAVQPSVSAPEGLHQTASSSVTAAGGVTSYISAPAFQPGTHSSTNIPFAIYEVQPRVSTSGGVTSFISAPAFQPGNHGNTNIPFTVFEVQPSVSGSGALFGPSALEELLKQTETGKQLIKRAARAPFTKESQRELVDIIAEHHNSQGSKATEENLEQYASAVALLFDKEEKDIYYTKRGGGKRNPGGKIYNRIHNQKQAKKRRDNLEEAHVSQENQAPEGDPVCQEAIEWLRLNVNPWSVTLDKWKSSFGYRRKSLQDPKCARECVDQFRHYSEQYGYQLVGTVCLNDSCDHHYTLNREYHVEMAVKFVGGKESIEKGERVVGSGRRSGQLYALDVFRREGAVGGGIHATAMMAWKPTPQSRLSQDKGPVDEESVEEETAADVPDGESVQELTTCLAGRQFGVAKLTEDKDEEGHPGALHSQPERGHCLAEGSTAGGQFTDFTEGTDDEVLTFALNTEAVAKNLKSADGSKRRSGLIHWIPIVVWQIFLFEKDETGNVDRFNLHLVEKSCSQGLGFDYEGTNASVTKILFPVCVGELCSVPIDADFALLNTHEHDGITDWISFLRKLLPHVTLKFRDAHSNELADFLRSQRSDQNLEHNKDQIACVALILLNNILKPTRVNKTFLPTIQVAQEDTILFVDSRESISQRISSVYSTYATMDAPAIPKLIFTGHDSLHLNARANQRQLSRSFRAPSSVDRVDTRVFFVVFFVSVAPRQSHSQASQQLFFDSISKRQQPAAKASSRVKRNEEKRDVSSVFSNESVSESECVVDFVTSEKCAHRVREVAPRAGVVQTAGSAAREGAPKCGEKCAAAAASIARPACKTQVEPPSVAGSARTNLRKPIRRHLQTNLPPPTDDCVRSKAKVVRVRLLRCVNGMLLEGSVKTSQEAFPKDTKPRRDLLWE
ncbi:conserved hypothetical protein [Culex quinquefasciatus]|uniref:Uncharacterized protein n=1 Tax=Culex quinquefasciatus TaxID=7176 RepID=B0WQ78_CULQU|nr:conserved hypothetical protein [Culex quinquefasciatus]|eukprot:XP_001850862.1 conserved hypothetical protein [Culex quinquefasciatus]